jgi:serine protease Do
MAAAVACGLGAATLGAAMEPQFLIPAVRSLFGGTPLAQANTGAAGFADLVDVVKPAVVGVQTKVLDDGLNPGRSSVDPFFRHGPQRGPEASRPRNGERRITAQGSAFFISADGYAVTNNHVIEGSKSAEIKTNDQTTYTARVVGSDPLSDLALLKVDGRDDFAHVDLADELPRVGDWVLAIGNPFGLGGTVTAGIVSARERTIGPTSVYENLIQIDAPINKGDSGGPTFDLAGKVIGVNTMIFSPSGGSIGIAFAIPAETVRSVIGQLKEKGSVTRGWLGVQIQAVTLQIADALGMKQAEGALIAEAQADGPAARAGVVAGDIVLSVNDRAIKDPSALSKLIAGSPPGAAVKLVVSRGGEEKSITITLGELPVQRAPEITSPEPETTGRGGPPDLGLTLAPAESLPGAGGEGVVVIEVDPQGRAAEQGFARGMVILEVSGKQVKIPAEIEDAIDAARTQGKKNVLMRVQLGDKIRFVPVEIG